MQEPLKEKKKREIPNFLKEIVQIKEKSLLKN